jgi:hypothetical protein
MQSGLYNHKENENEKTYSYSGNAAYTGYGVG